MKLSLQTLGHSLLLVLGVCNICSAADLAFDDESPWENKPLEIVRHDADAGETRAMLVLYEDYFQGINVNANRHEALKWLKKAAEGNNPCAQCMFGWTCEEPSQGEPGATRPNMSEAFVWYQRSAAQGWPSGEYHLGCCYLEGNGVEQDEVLGVEWIRQGADQGHPLAMKRLVEIYAQGIASPRNDNDSPLEILAKLALGNSKNYRVQVEEAYDMLVFRYEFGLGTHRDIIIAAEWYCLAVINQTQYFTLLDKIDVGHPNPEQSRTTGTITRDNLQTVAPHRWDRDDPMYPALSLVLHAVASDSQARLHIGDMYSTGNGAPLDAIHAWVWYALASQSGSAEATGKMATAEKNLSANDLTKAKNILTYMTQLLKQTAAAIGQ